MTGRSDETVSAPRTVQRPRRRRDGVRRSHQVTVALNDQELAQLDAASQRAELSLGAYLATAAVAHATRDEHPAPVDGELVRWVTVAADEATRGWRTLRVVGGLLNQVAKTGNSTGELPPNAGEVITRVARAVEHADAAATALHGLATELTASLPRPGARHRTGR